MSTSAIVVFGRREKGKFVTVARVRIHDGGDPESMKPELRRFFAVNRAETNGDAREDEPGMLATRFVVHMARLYATMRARSYVANKANVFTFDVPNDDPRVVARLNAAPLDFLSVRMHEGPLYGDVYYIECNRSEGVSNAPPIIQHKALRD